jgi:hypothetical protein
MIYHYYSIEWPPLSKRSYALLRTRNVPRLPGVAGYFPVSGTGRWLCKANRTWISSSERARL